MKKIMFIFSISYLFVTGSAMADDKCYQDSKSLVNGLYKEFPIDSNKIVEQQDEKTISRFFSKKMTKLLIKDYVCSERNQGVCKLDFDILTHAQDDPIDKKFKYMQISNKLVTIRMQFPDYPDFIDFIIDDKEKCKKIENIQYSDDTSLLKILSR